MKIRPSIEMILPEAWAKSLQRYLETSKIDVQVEYLRESMHNGAEYKLIIPPGLESINHVSTMIFFAGINMGMQ